MPTRKRLAKRDVERAIVRSLEGKSLLTDYAKSALGMADMFTRHLICNLADKRTYLEVGTLLGATAIAASCSAEYVTAIDDFRYWDKVPEEDDEMNPLWGSMDVRGMSMRDAWAKQTEGISNIELISFAVEECCFGVRDPVDVVYFDGDHSAKGTAEGLRIVQKELRPSVLVVDDYFGDTIKQGVEDAGLLVDRSWFLQVRNGIFIATME